MTGSFKEPSVATGGGAGGVERNALDAFEHLRGLVESLEELHAALVADGECAAAVCAVAEAIADLRATSTKRALSWKQLNLAAARGLSRLDFVLLSSRCTDGVFTKYLAARNLAAAFSRAAVRAEAAALRQVAIEQSS